MPFPFAPAPVPRSRRSPRVHSAIPALLALCAFATGADAQSTTRAQQEGGTWYAVEIPQHDRRLARVEARIELTDSVLIMFPRGADHLPDGWSTYLRGLAATNDDGRPVTLRRAGRDRWIVATPRPTAIRLRYEVLLHHDSGDWPLGPKEASAVKADGVFLTGRALFITQLGMRQAHVRMQLPPRWRLATPWQEATGAAGTYRVPSATELLQVGMLAGRHQQRRLLFGDATVFVAVGQSLPGALDPIAETLSSALVGADALFGGTPRGRFVAIANADDFGGGVAFTRSFNMLFRSPVTRETRSEWAHVVVHELLHMWLGGAINTPDGQQEHWLLEGGTDYLANILELRSGIITREQLYDRVAANWDRYRVVAGTQGLRAAGANKLANYDLVYSGGLLASLMLDVELRRATDGRAGLDSLVKRLYVLHGRTGELMAYTSIRREALRLGGPAIEPLFTRYVEGAERIPLDRVLASLGYALESGATPEARSRITVAPERTAVQQGLERRILGAP